MKKNDKEILIMEKILFKSFSKGAFVSVNRKNGILDSMKEYAAPLKKEVKALKIELEEVLQIAENNAEKLRAVNNLLRFERIHCNEFLEAAKEKLNGKHSPGIRLMKAVQQYEKYKNQTSK